MTQDCWARFLCATIKELLDNTIEVTETTRLLGANGVLSSLRFVELMLAIEDKCQEEGVPFDWTADSVMSENRSSYQDIATLSDFLATLSGDQGHV